MEETGFFVREVYLLYLTRYIHLNPVKARLVEAADDWEFSSYPEYIGSQSGTLPKMDVVRTQFRSPEQYRLFVENVENQQFIKHLMFDE